MPFTALREEDFLGRREELAALMGRSLDAANGAGRPLVLTGAAGVGKTELLSQLCAQLFWKQDRVAPFRYTVNAALLSAKDFARDFLTQFVCQRIAFDSRDQSLLSPAGMSLDALAAAAQERRASWAHELLAHYDASAREPLDALRNALAAPHLAALRSGKPVVLLIDEFPRLTGLHRDGTGETQLAPLFEAFLVLPMTRWIVTGNETELLEMPLTAGFERFPVMPLGDQDAAALFSSLRRRHPDPDVSLPASLARHLHGNPRYLNLLAAAAGPRALTEERDFWAVYLQEALQGGIFRHGTALLTRAFSDRDARRKALLILETLSRSDETLTRHRIAQAARLQDDDAESLLQSLHRAGFVAGAFGLYRTPDDAVVRDVTESLIARELHRRSFEDVERTVRGRLPAGAEKAVSYELVLPGMRDAELVAAQCLEQIGKNVPLPPEIVGQLQVALLEACINAREHGDEPAGNVFVRFEVGTDRIVISVESPGREFVPLETGEPVVGIRESGRTGRGWGIKLMKNFVDAVTFEKTPRGTRVVLVKNLLKPTNAHKEGIQSGA